CLPPVNFTLSAGSSPFRSQLHSADSFQISVLPDLVSPLPFHWPTNSLRALRASLAGSGFSAGVAVVAKNASKVADPKAMRSFMPITWEGVGVYRYWTR